jgi:hypothetical protein
MNDSQHPPQKPAEEVWACYSEDESGTSDYFILGSRAGLQRLKEHIEIAIGKGESLIQDEPGMDFSGIRRQEKLKQDDAKLGWGEKAVMVGCLGFIITALVLAVIGLVSLFKD